MISQLAGLFSRTETKVSSNRFDRPKTGMTIDNRGTEKFLGVRLRRIISDFAGWEVYSISPIRHRETAAILPRHVSYAVLRPRRNTVEIAVTHKLENVNDLAI